MFVSIRLLGILLVLGCIVVTAVLCLTLAVTSSEDALDKTKQSRDTSVKDAFAVGEASVLRSVDENMNTLGNEALEFLSSFFTSHRLTAQAALGIFQRLGPGETAPTWETIFAQRNALWNFVSATNRAGLTSLGVTTYNYVAFHVSEVAETISRGPDEYHHLVFVMVNGSVYDHQAWFNGMQGVPAKHRMVVASSIPETGEAHGYPHDIGNILLGTCSGDSANALSSNGTVPDKACSMDSLPFGDVHGLSWQLPSVAQGANAMRWSVPQNLGAAGYSLMYIYGIFGTASVFKAGQVSGGVDLRTIANFVKNIKIGVPEDGGESYGRLYTAVKEYPVPVTLIAVSHGNATKDDPGNPGGALSLAPMNATDPVISETASAIETKLGGYDAVVNATVLQNYTIATNRTPDGEGFYVKVREFYDKFGIDWYVVIIVDREYILGEIVRNTQQTQQDIATSEKQVDDDLKQARVFLFIMVSGCAVVMLILSVVLVLQITAPILKLGNEMALVAVMDLENVDLKEKSSLSEVRGMQESFAVMIANLVEYREYMPASVLVIDVEQDINEVSELECESSKSPGTISRGMSAGLSAGIPSMRRDSRRSSVHDKNISMKNLDLRTKKIALAVLNMKGWLSCLDPQHTLRAYLEVVLSEATARRTIVDEFNGDRVYISGNGARQLTNPAPETARVLLTILQSCEKIGICVTAVATTGKAQCGNIGCQGLKKYSFVGPIASWLHMFSLVSGRYQEAPVVVDEFLKRDLGLAFNLKIIDKVTYKKLCKTDILLHHLVEESEGVTENEWMYQLEERNKSNPFRDYDAVMDAVLKKKFDEALVLLQGVENTPYREFLSNEILARKEDLPRFMLDLDDL